MVQLVQGSMELEVESRNLATVSSFPEAMSSKFIGSEKLLRQIQQNEFVAQLSSSIDQR